MKPTTLLCCCLLLFLAAGCEIDPCGDTKKVEKIEAITVANDTYSLITPDADKDCHARFVVRYRWVNAKRNQDPLAPDPTSGDALLNLGIILNTSIGTFGPLPNVEKREDTEGGVTTYHWLGQHDIGAKNEQTNPTRFKIDATAYNIGNLVIPDGEDNNYYDVEIDGQITYTVYTPPAN